MLFNNVPFRIRRGLEMLIDIDLNNTLAVSPFSIMGQTQSVSAERIIEHTCVHTHTQTHTHTHTHTQTHTHARTYTYTHTDTDTHTHTHTHNKTKQNKDIDPHFSKNTNNNAYKK